MKYYGAIGFSEEEVEVRPGVFRAGITERNYAGDYNRITRSFQTAEHLNDNLTISSEISIIGDPYAFSNLANIRYAVIRGTKWKVININDAQHPRITLMLGGPYNDTGGSQAETS